jgi:hypothetical protein
MVDLYHDIRRRRHNYVLSLLYHDAGEGAKRYIDDILRPENSRDEGDDILGSFPEAKAAASEKALFFLENGLKTLFDPAHQFLVKPAVSFLSKRIGAANIMLE